MTVGQVAQSLRPAFAGIKAGDWEDPTGEMRDVNVRLAPGARAARVRSRAAPARDAGPCRTVDTPARTDCGPSGRASVLRRSRTSMPSS